MSGTLRIAVIVPIVLLLSIGVSAREDKKHSKKTTTMSTASVTNYRQVNGLKMYYEIWGQGAPLVLIHGGGSTIQTTFGRALPTLAKSFRVIAVELQAHGHTSDRDAPERFEQDADDVYTLLVQLGIQKASFLGFSNGGNTAIQIAVRHPQIVHKLILASTFYKREGFPSGFFEGMKQATLRNMPQVLIDAFLKVNADTAQLHRMFTKDRDRMVQFQDWSDSTLRAIDRPTLFVVGDRDVVSATHTAAMSTLVKDSHLVILPALHGEYMGVAECPVSDPRTLEYTLHLFERFLLEEKQKR